MRFTIIPALALLGCTPLSGQALNGSMRSLGKLLADGSSPQSFPANKDMGSRLVLFGGTSLYSAERSNGTRAKISVQDLAIARVGLVFGRTGPNKIRFRLANQTNQILEGKIHLRHAIQFSVSAMGYASAKVDIGQNGKTDYAGSFTKTANVTRSFVILIPTGGLDIAIETAVSTITAAGSPVIETRLFLEVETPSVFCTTLHYGARCADASIRQSATNVLSFILSKGLINKPGFFVLGTQATSIPLPLQGCRMLVDLGVLIPIRSNLVGAALVTVPLPPNYVGSARGQFLLFRSLAGSLDVQTTNGLHVQCK